MLVLRSKAKEMEMDEGKGVALVTGASSGMGREIAVRLAGKGFQVIVAARRADRLRELSERFPSVSARPVDLSVPEEVEEFCGYISKLPEPVTVLINAAGYSIRGALEDVLIEAGRRLFQVNLFSLIRVTQACLPGMRKQRQGTIVNVSSMAGKFAFPMSGVYAATKHAVEAITDSLRIEVRPFGIRVVAIRPGFVATEFNDVANRMTGDLLSRADQDYRPLYQASGAAVGKLFVNATVPGPEVVAEVVLEAVLSDSPKPVYSAGYMSEELLAKRRSLDDEGFDRYFSDLTGLWDLRI
jgi:short-subunit dehydrogenase